MKYLVCCKMQLEDLVNNEDFFLKKKGEILHRRLRSKEPKIIYNF